MTSDFFAEDLDNTNNSTYWEATTADGTISLDSFCSTNDCCNSGGDVNGNSECGGWNRAVTYMMCSNSCKDNGYVCSYIAGRSNGGYVKIHSNSCKGGAGSVCRSIGFNMNTANIEIFSGACVSDINFACGWIGRDTNTLTRIEIPTNECSKADGDTFPSKCLYCGRYSAFTGTFVATDSCCAADNEFYDGSFSNSYYDKECHASPAPSFEPSVSSVPSDVPSDMPSDQPSDIPSDMPSNIPSDMPSSLPSSVPSISSSPSSFPSSIPSESSQPSREPTPRPTPAPTPKICSVVNCNNGAGKCEAVSLTDYKCVCEATFINTNNGRNCECPPGFERKSDNRCYDPDVPVPSPQTKSPTKAPTTKSPTVPPSPAPINTVVVEQTCSDEVDGTFTLNNGKTKKCIWLSKNAKREKRRKNRYCGLNRVKLVCPSSCDFCECSDDDSYTFSTDNVGTKNCAWLSPHNQKNKEKRIARYCTEDFDNGKVMNACTKSCGLCPSE